MFLIKRAAGGLAAGRGARTRCAAGASSGAEQGSGRASGAGAAACGATHGRRARRAAAFAAAAAAGLLLLVALLPLARRLVLGGTVIGSLVTGGAAYAETDARQGEVAHTDNEWREILSPQAYTVLRQAGTERRGSSALNGEKRPGTFRCAGCGAALFSSSAKYESGTGWPSFYEAIDGAVEERPDWSIAFMPRTEVRCARCKGHLGHSFDDGPPPTGTRYCMNGIALSFEPAARGA